MGFKVAVYLTVTCDMITLNGVFYLLSSVSIHDVNFVL